MSNQDVNFRFGLAALMTSLSSPFVGFVNVGSLYVFGIPLVPLAVSLLILWTTKTSIRNKALGTLGAVLFIPVGFFIWVWWADITIRWNW